MPSASGGPSNERIAAIPEMTGLLNDAYDQLSEDCGYNPLVGQIGKLLERIGAKKFSNPYPGHFWGWDDESVYFVRLADRHIGGPADHVHRLQDYPDLMREIFAICERHFGSAQ